MSSDNRSADFRPLLLGVRDRRAVHDVHRRLFSGRRSAIDPLVPGDELVLQAQRHVAVFVRLLVGGQEAPGPGIGVVAPLIARDVQVGRVLVPGFFRANLSIRLLLGQELVKGLGVLVAGRGMLESG